MTLVEQERERIQANIQVYRQKWEQLNDLQRENLKDQRRYAQLEVELKKTEREIIYLERLLAESDELYETTQQAEQNETPPAEFAEFTPRQPKKPGLLGLAIAGGIFIVLVLVAGWFFLSNSSDKRATSTTSGRVGAPNTAPTNFVINGDFEQDLEGWEDKTGTTGEGSNTRSLFLEGIPAADNSGQRVLQMEHSGAGNGFIAQTVKVEGKGNLTFSAYLGGRADMQPADKQSYAYLLVQLNGKNGTALGGTVYQVAPAGFRVSGLADRNRYRLVELAPSLTRYNFDLQSEATRLKIDLKDITSVTIQVQAGAAKPGAGCSQNECKSEIQVATIELH